MKALVLEKKLDLSIRNIDLPTTVHSDSVKIKMHTVGICGSDVHYYTHGKIGPFVVKEPMVLGHEGSGTIIEIGSNVSNLKVGDRVCVEPGVPDVNSKEYMKGIYNLDPKLTFWATPPDHGCLTPEVVFPSNFVFKLPDNVSYAEGAMIEPLAVGLQAAEKAKIIPGETALVMGCGPIGLVIALTALAGGCSKVFIADIVKEKLRMCENYENLINNSANKTPKNIPIKIFQCSANFFIIELFCFLISGQLGLLQPYFQQLQLLLVKHKGHVAPCHRIQFLFHYQ